MFFQLILFVLPWNLRRRILNWHYQWDIDKSARIGFSIILAKTLKMGVKSRIHNMVCCKRIDRLEMGEDSGIAPFTYITGFSVNNIAFFKHIANRRCELILGKSAGITSRHFIDCNGGVYIGDFTTIAGIRTQILTHSIDVYNNRQDAQPVMIGKYCFIGTGCILLPGSVLPDYSVLGAGSVLTKPQEEQLTLYAGSPAKPRKKLDLSRTMYFHRQKHVVD